MTQYINKDALLTEIRKRFDEYSSSILKYYDACKEAKAQELGKILIILDTLEVKEVDLEEKACNAYCKVCGHYAHTTPTYICRQACDYYKDFKQAMK